MRKKRIMLVEDEAITAMRIASSLEKMGYAFTSAVFSAEEAIEKAADEKPDLILMDIVLRGEKDGIEAAGQIQSRFNIPVVYITALSDEKILKRIKKTEPFGYIVKPFKDRELHGAVEIALYKHEIEERLRESEMRYRNLFKNATDAIYLFDPETQQIIDCNPKAAEITGYTIRELKSIKMAELHPDTEQGVVSKIFQKIRETGLLSDISGINQLTKDGELIPVEINAITMKLEGKKYGLCIIRDITKRKKAEDKLRESEERFHALFEQASDAIVIFDAETGMLTQFNNRAFENLGYTSKEFKNLKLSDIEVIEFPDGILRHMEKIKKEGRGTFETKHRNKGGQIRDILVNAKVINIREKDYIQSTWIDITERKMMEEQLKAAAITDDLTGLFNRQGFFALATQQCKLADRTKRLMSLLYLDINGLKTINDELGHREGDRALIDTAGILKMTFRESDIIARTGGDEFAVLLTEPSEPDIENVVINHLRSKLAEFNIRKYRNYELILSMGMAHYDPERSCSIDELIVKADDLMYEDKKHHKLLQNTETVLKTNIKRRKYKRYMTGGNCMAELDSLQKVRIRDISNGGICLISPQSPYMNSICKIRIFTTDNEELTKTGVVGRLSLTGEVIHRENNLSFYKYGLKFIDMKKNVKSSLDKFINNLAD